MVKKKVSSGNLKKSVSKSKSSYEDLQKDIRKIQTPPIEIWKNKHSDRDYAVYLSTSECTCICPKTGLPDFATINVSYVPGQHCIELKSFKMYIHSFRDVGIFHEHLVNIILDDIVKACKPKWVKVEGIVAVRGGIQTTVVAEYKRNKKIKGFNR